MSMHPAARAGLFAGAFALAPAAAPVWAHGVTERVSLGPGGVQANGISFAASLSPISAGGRFVAFQSSATNLMPGDSGGVFVRDRKLGATRRVSIGLGGAQENGSSFGGTISADGRFVAFQSSSTNLVPGDDTNDAADVFVRDRLKGTIERVSLGPSGQESCCAAISADGRFVAFHLVPDDRHDTGDVFVRDRKLGRTERVNLGPGGVQGNGNSYGASISADGRFVAFESFATNLVPGDTNNAVDAFVRDRKLGTTRRVSLGPGGVQGNGFSRFPSISADGRFVAFWSGASNLVPGDTNNAIDVFVRDRKLGTTRRVSLGPGNVQGNGGSIDSAISADGRYVAFGSDASNLVPRDTNGFSDVFVRILAP